MFRKSQAKFIKSFILILVLFMGITYAFQGGDGTQGDPYQISTCSELQNMSSCLSCNYTLGNNVDCSGFDKNSDGKGFMPIGNCTGSCMASGDGIDYPFSGTFNGQNYEIAGLFINRTSVSPVGIFTFISSSKIIALRVSSAEVYGGSNVGGLVGESNGIINDSYFIGNVNGTDFVGGIAGVSYTIIKDSYSSGLITGGDRTGGLTGSNEGNIFNSYSLANVIGISTGFGGLTGVNYGLIQNSYSAGNIQGGDWVGGIVGGNWGMINSSYSTGDVSGTTTGSVIGRHFSGTITNNYWNNHSGNPNRSIGSGSSIGITSIQDNISWFYDCTNEPIASWNTTNDWSCLESSFPQLVWQVPPSASSSSIGNSIFPFQNIKSIFILLSILLGYLIFS